MNTEPIRADDFKKQFDEDYDWLKEVAFDRDKKYTVDQAINAGKLIMKLTEVKKHVSIVEEYLRFREDVLSKINY